MNKIVKIGFIVGLFVGGIIFLLWKGDFKDNSLLGESEIFIWEAISNKLAERNGLEKIVKGALEGAEGNYAVAVKNLKTKEEYYLNGHQSFVSGSLYKLWVMAVVFREKERGNISGDEVLSDDISSLNNKFGIGTESAELTEGAISLTVDDALRQMITISHNYAALLLTARIGPTALKTFLSQNNFNESSVGGDMPVTTAFDMVRFFEKLYQGELGNATSSAQMLKLLKAQELNNKLPRFLPTNTVVAHKTGEIDYFTHDGGIIFIPEGDYVIVVLSKSDYPPGAEERIGRISEAVHRYFKNGGL